MFINYKREIYALAHLNLSTASFRSKLAHMFYYGLYNFTLAYTTVCSVSI